MQSPCMRLRWHPFMRFWHAMGHRFFRVTFSCFLSLVFLASHVAVQLVYFVINRCNNATACHTINSWLSHVLHGLFRKFTFACFFLGHLSHSGDLLLWVGIHCLLTSSPQKPLGQLIHSQLQCKAAKGQAHNKWYTSFKT